MPNRKYLAIRRDDRFSPNSIEKDRSILEAVCNELEAVCQLSEKVEMIDEAEFAVNAVASDCYISMARSEEALLQLDACARQGCAVINASQGVKNCQRSLLDATMRAHGIPMPATEGDKGYWLKRGDAAAQSKSDVVFCATRQELEMAQAEFRRRDIEDMVISAHVEGDLVKFYGVGERMFRYYYPSDDGISKFGDEARNGQARHYAFSQTALRKTVAQLAELVGVTVYGGDAIIDEHGNFYIIDFNDWPSFSRCRDEAARAIVQEILEKKR